METAFTLLLGVEHPLQQAVMGGVSGPELAGAVGMLCEFDDEAAVWRMTRALRLGDGGAIGMGFFGQWIDRETFEMASDRLRVVKVFCSEPDAAVVARARRSGAALVGWQVGSLDEALAAVDAGCDFVVAQEREAGGHVRGTLPGQELLELVLSRVRVPVVTAGGDRPSRGRPCSDRGGPGSGARRHPLRRYGRVLCPPGIRAGAAGRDLR